MTTQSAGTDQTPTQHPQMQSAPPAQDHFLPDPKAIINLHNVSKFYGQIVGLNNVSLNIQPGVTGLLGPNGAGKSTMLKVLTGQIKPEQGSVSVLGMNVWDNPKLNHMLGYCPEQDSFYENMMGLDFVSLMARLSGFSKEEAITRAWQAMFTVGMIKRDCLRKIRAYSKGMRQKVKLAQAIVHNPKLLILDEPLAGTDPIARRHIINLVANLGKRGMSILVSSHVLHEVERMTQTIVLMNQGKILAEGDIHTIRDLIDEHPHTISIITDEPRKLAVRLLREECVLSAQVNSETSSLTIFTSAPDDFYSLFPKIIVKDGIKIDSIQSPDDNLEAVFKYLIR